MKKFAVIIAVSGLLALPSHAEPAGPHSELENGAVIPNSPHGTPIELPSDPGQAAAVRAWQDARFGLFIHWGVYSTYAGTYKGKELWSAEWIQENARIPFEEYSAAAADWAPCGFDADAIVKTARDAGMRYIVITSRHHDGFAMYPSKASNYNLMDWAKYKGPDPLAALKAACQKYGLLFGIYYSPLEFRGSPKGFDEADAKAVEAGFDYRSLGPKPYASADDIAALAHAQIKELCEWYHPDILWFDGCFDKMGRWTEEDAVKAAATVRSIVPNVVINPRLGAGANFRTVEGKLPKKDPQGIWEYCWNIGVFWGYNPRNYTKKRLKNPEHYIETLVHIAALGGNYLLNVGPDGDGRLHPMAVEYLKCIGEWVRANGECIYGTEASPFAEDFDWGYATKRKGKIYLIVREWPLAGQSLSLPALGSSLRRAYLLLDELKKPIEVSRDGETWKVKPDAAGPQAPFTVIVLEVDA